MKLPSCNELISSTYVATAIYIVAFLGLFGITIEKTCRCFILYLKEPTYTDMVLVSQEEADFPSMTFCPMWNNAFKKDILKVHSKIILTHIFIITVIYTGSFFVYF